jgi:hypothetical protein
MSQTLINTIDSASAAYIMADGLLIQRNNVSDWQVNSDKSLSIFINRSEFIFTDRDHIAAVWDWCNPDRVDDEGLTPRWKKYQIDWYKVGTPEDYQDDTFDAVDDLRDY